MLDADYDRIANELAEADFDAWASGDQRENVDDWMECNAHEYVQHLVMGGDLYHAAIRDMRRDFTAWFAEAYADEGMGMSESKFTPGPWVAEYVGSSGNADVYEVTNGHHRIAEYVDEKDARLIAAAPDLYGVLAELIRVADHSAPVDLMADIGAVVNQARAALAKVES